MPTLASVTDIIRTCVLVIAVDVFSAANPRVDTISVYTRIARAIISVVTICSSLATIGLLRVKAMTTLLGSRIAYVYRARIIVIAVSIVSTANKRTFALTIRAAYFLRAIVSIITIRITAAAAL